MDAKRKTLNIISWLVVLGFLIYLLIPEKAAPPPDADLKPAHKSLSTEKNTFGTLERAAQTLFLTPDSERDLYKQTDPKTWNTNLVAQILEDNREVLALWQTAVARGELQVPLPKDAQDSYPYLVPWRQLARVACIEAARLRAAGQPNAALALAMQVIQFGNLVEQSGGTVSHWYAGLFIKDIGLLSLRQTVRESPLSATDLAACIARLENCRISEPALTETLKVEYQLMRKHIEDMHAGKMFATNSAIDQMAFAFARKPLFDLEKSRLIAVQMTRTGLQGVPVYFSQVNWTDIPNVEADDSFFEWLTSGNAVGKITIADQSPSWRGIFARKASFNSHVGAVQLLLAIKRYVNANGSLPGQLSDLVPNYIPSVPLDGFDGRPLRYAREKKLIYSVGDDLLDSGGVTRSKRKGPSDIVYEIDPKTYP